MIAFRAGACAVLAVFFAALSSNDAKAAGTAYNVDTSEVADGCKLEAWTSLARNRDMLASFSPSCSLALYRPTEFAVQFDRTRADGEYASAFTPKIKVKLKDSGVGEFGLAITTNATFDAATGENTQVTVLVPATMRFSNVARLNLNAGWTHDKTLDRNFFAYGAGIDVRTPDNMWIVTAEVFGFTGNGIDIPPSVLRPRGQLGLRWRPVEAWSADIILGRNLAGENSRWITFATAYRFSLGN
ncbi:MAG: hypothetical protein KF794_14690 [Xanthobacteraceae bacterium]|nr:hypothetical protein [Xanthobacteraceae bacterium]QYK44976.1 MAG: hypothetical protein KF794_14690 [Xanthobacteraceae bacterium]HMN52243.1 hypothetical protein [Xanthobacteraceae bacterium]